LIEAAASVAVEGRWRLRSFLLIFVASALTVFASAAWAGAHLAATRPVILHGQWTYDRPLTDSLLAAVVVLGTVAALLVVTAWRLRTPLLIAAAALVSGGGMANWYGMRQLGGVPDFLAVWNVGGGQHLYLSIGDLCLAAGVAVVALVVVRALWRDLAAQKRRGEIPARSDFSDGGAR
jgi:hypothetical protein